MPAPTTSSAPESAHSKWVEAFNARDLDKLLALYEPDAVLCVPERNPARGHEAIREALKGFFSLNGTLEINTSSVTVSGDLALLRGNWRLIGATKPDGSPLQIAHRSAEVVRRQPDGRWLYVIDHPSGAD